MQTGVTEEFIATLQEEAEMYGRDVMSGHCASYDVYKFKVGYIQGLQTAERILHETIEKMLNIQDLDD